MNNIREKSHRLLPKDYQGEVIVTFTACLKGRSIFFVNEQVVGTVESILLSEARRFSCDVEAYVFMPDHCHIILRGRSESADVLKVMKQFKQKTGFWFSKHLSDVCWQKDYYDHIIRSDEELNKQIMYIFANPVRSGIVGDWKVYPFKGSTVHQWRDWD